MKAARAFPDISQIENLAPSVIYELASGKADEVREHFINQAESGQTVHLKDVREAIREGNTSDNVSNGSTPTFENRAKPIIAKIATAYNSPGDVEMRHIKQGIEEYTDEDQREIAEIVAAFGDACLKAATPYLEGR